jgi:hypothetical protein
MIAYWSTFFTFTGKLILWMRQVLIFSIANLFYYEKTNIYNFFFDSYHDSLSAISIVVYDLQYSL